MVVKFSGEFIRLDNVLKLSGMASTGGEAKIAIQQGAVLLNGEKCTMRGKKLFGGETVLYKGEEIKVVV